MWRVRRLEKSRKSVDVFYVNRKKVVIEVSVLVIATIKQKKWLRGNQNIYSNDVIETLNTIHRIKIFLWDLIHYFSLKLIKSRRILTSTSQLMDQEHFPYSQWSGHFVEKIYVIINTLLRLWCDQFLTHPHL